MFTSEFIAWISPDLIESSSVVPPASSTALRGSVSSTCSTPSVARIAMVFPSSSLAMVSCLLVRDAYGLKRTLMAPSCFFWKVA